MPPVPRTASRILACAVVALGAACGPPTGSTDAGDAGSILGNMLSPDATSSPPDASPNCPNDYQQLDLVLQSPVTCFGPDGGRNQCEVETLTCSLAGVCWTVENANVKSAVNTLVETLTTDNCSVPASSCMCPPMPQSVACVAGLCVTSGGADAGSGDGGPGSG